MARVHLASAFEVLANLMQSAGSESVRVDCAKTLAAYAAGKPRQLEPKRNADPAASDREVVAALEAALESATKALDTARKATDGEPA